MQPIQSSLQGGTPQLAVAAVDPTLPACGKPVDAPEALRGEGLSGTDAFTCTRKRGHYGRCGVVPVEST